jgi:peptidoglycan/LPS O-acetylase OafA/YrhL
LGSIGVVTFFLLSGYLIFRAAWRRFGANEDGFGDYMFDRVSRIFVPFIPALLLAVAVSAFLPVANYGEPGINEGPVAFLGNLTLLHNHPIFQALQIAGIDSSAFRIRPYNTAEPFWTIPVEFWLYAFFGVLVFVGWRRETVAPWLIVLLLLAATPTVVWNTIAGTGNCLTIIWAMGAAFAWASVGHKPGGFGMLLAFLALGLGPLGMISAWKQGRFDPYELQIAFFFACVLFGGVTLLRRAPNPPAFIQKPIAFLAQYSYSLYLVHNTVLIVWITLFHETTVGSAIASVVAAHIVAIAFYYLFERHHKAVGRYLKRVVLHKDFPVIVPVAAHIRAHVDANADMVAQPAPARVTHLRRPQ